MGLSIEDVLEGFTTLGADDDRFEAMAEAVLAYQQDRNPVYAAYSQTHRFLPVEAFKRVPVTTFPAEQAERVFESSRTGRGQPSRHYVRDVEVYARAFKTHFAAVFGGGPFTLLAHLPHYEAQGQQSSLLFMVQELVHTYGDASSGFFLDDLSMLHQALSPGRNPAHRLILFGAAFGLLDLVERGSFTLPTDALVIETGGMKTYRRSITREALHARLAEGFGVRRAQVWSEYGMCELMSQCYTRGGNVFYPPPWMRCYVLDPDDPGREMPAGEPGVLAVLDLANVYSAAALLTEDRAVRRGQGVEILGRLSQAALRGCNFLIEHPTPGGSISPKTTR